MRVSIGSLLSEMRKQPVYDLGICAVVKFAGEKVLRRRGDKLAVILVAEGVRLAALPVNIAQAGFVVAGTES